MDKPVYTTNERGFDIKLYMLEEYLDPCDLIEDPEEQAEIYRKIESGLLAHFCAKVTASKHGIELGNDYLGNCVYRSIDEFIKDPYFTQMVDGAIEEAIVMQKALFKDWQVNYTCPVCDDHVIEQRKDICPNCHTKPLTSED